MKLAENPRIAIAGSVNSSVITLSKLIEHECNLVAVLALNPEKARNVSGYHDLKKLADKHGVNSLYFDNINDDKVYEYLKKKNIDLFFVVGLSQLVKDRLLNLPNYGCIGYHPTKLPKGRGRGAIAWLILGKAPGAVTYFLMDKGMDSGEIICQREYEIFDGDYANDVIDRIKMTIGLALDDLLPMIKKGELPTRPQNEREASFLGRRRPKDGNIDWNKSSEDIGKLIRATSTPLPGAFSFYNGEKVIIWKCRAETVEYHGFPGRILKIDKLTNEILVATSDGAIWLTHYEIESKKPITFKKEEDFSNK